MDDDDGDEDDEDLVGPMGKAPSMPGCQPWTTRTTRTTRMDEDMVGPDGSRALAAPCGTCRRHRHRRDPLSRHRRRSRTVPTPVTPGRSTASR